LIKNPFLSGNISPNCPNAWEKLKSHHSELSKKSIVELFLSEKDREKSFSLSWEDFFVDFSKNKINSTTIDILLDLVKELDLKESIDALFSGKKINETENRSVLHTALRSETKDTLLVDGENIISNIQENKKRMFSLAKKIINEEWRGFSDKPIKTIVNVGIGGSNLGPVFVNEALKFYRNDINIRFISNIEGDHLFEILKSLDPESTIFIIASKTFTTQETIINAKTIKDWFLQKSSIKSLGRHFIAVTSSTEKAKAFEIADENIFHIADWTGGRFSLWGPVGLSICISIGPNNFERLLNGAYSMDKHFKNTEFKKNIPVILALISVWYNNFWGADSEAVIPYSQYLKNFPSYLQQASMESNGKNINRDGEKVSYQTGNIIWGSTGTNAQHAFFQLLHQGTKIIPIDFIGFVKSLHKEDNQQDKLISNLFGQAEALMLGKNKSQVIKELEKKGLSKKEIFKLAPYKIFDGNRPSNTIMIKQLTPYNLGALIALYEHKIFVQGIVWNIFSFDQWGVELGKELANKIYNDMSKNRVTDYDPSTKQLIKFYLNAKKD
tara:strand:- start:10536 stop:12200 length:1665 start_codon:yes stop_codon:yes gene_type:complete